MGDRKSAITVSSIIELFSNAKLGEPYPLASAPVFGRKSLTTTATATPVRGLLPKAAKGKIDSTVTSDTDDMTVSGADRNETVIAGVKISTTVEEYKYQGVTYRLNVTREPKLLFEHILPKIRASLFTDKNLYQVHASTDNEIVPNRNQHVVSDYNHLVDRVVCRKYSRLYVVPEQDEIDHINLLDKDTTAGHLIHSSLCKVQGLILRHMLKTFFHETFTFGTKTPYSQYLKRANIVDVNNLLLFDKRDVFFIKSHEDDVLTFTTQPPYPLSQDTNDKEICFFYTTDIGYYRHEQSVRLLELLYDRTTIPLYSDFLDFGRTAGDTNEYVHGLLTSTAVSQYRHQLSPSVYMFTLPPMPTE